jgi:hypothetical protein
MAEKFTPEPGRKLIEGKTGRFYEHGDELPEKYLTEARVAKREVVPLKGKKTISTPGTSPGRQ